MLRRLPFALLCALLVASTLPAAEAPLDRYQTVTVEPTKPSIYVGTVSLTMPVLVREGATYATTYAARVFPYFFSSEQGRLWIDFPVGDLRRLERGETINFTGRARNDDGEERRVEGRVVPADAFTGKIKVRVFVSKRIELIFNTTYRFGENTVP